MCSSAELWSHGRNVWRIQHDAQQSIRHIEADGQVPATYVQVLREMTAQQDAEDGGPAEVDFFFEIPLQVAKGITGFKHDEEAPGVDYENFSEFAWTAPSESRRGRRWWQIWK